MIVREEVAADHDAIRAVNDAAFGRPEEGRLIERLREDRLIVASLVAVIADRIAGSVVFSDLPIRTTSGEIAAASLAPIAVMPGNQRCGVGSALIDEGLRLCKQRGKLAVLVLGDPGYYQRFGFSASLAQRITGPFSGPAWMAHELIEGSLRDTDGRVIFPDSFRDV